MVISRTLEKFTLPNLSTIARNHVEAPIPVWYYIAARARARAFLFLFSYFELLSRGTKHSTVASTSTIVRLCTRVSSLSSWRRTKKKHTLSTCGVGIATAATAAAAAAAAAISGQATAATHATIFYFVFLYVKKNLCFQPQQTV